MSLIKLVGGIGRLQLREGNSVGGTEFGGCGGGFKQVVLFCYR